MRGGSGGGEGVNTSLSAHPGQIILWFWPISFHVEVGGGGGEGEEEVGVNISLYAFLLRQV